MSSLAGRRQLPLDGVTSLLVHGLARDNAGLPVVIQLPKEQPSDPRTDILPHLEPIRALPSPLPPTAGPHVHLEVAVVSEHPPLEEGESQEDEMLDTWSDEDDPYQRAESTVYSVRPLDPNQYPYFVPPLVIKVGAQREGRRVYREAGMYKTLETVQGLVVPRCYGYFRIAVNQYETTIMPWDPKCKFPRDPTTFDVFRPPHPSASLNILLLEEVGGRIPLYTIPRKELRTELLAMYKELAGLSVDHGDIRYENVLLAPSSPLGLEGRSAAKFGRPYKFRLIDFEHAVRTNRLSLARDLRLGVDRLVAVLCGE